MTLHTYGGRHTERDKLQPLKEYLGAYTVALSKQPFDLIYIDAFAGTGSRDILQSASPLLDGVESDDSHVTMPGSARVALGINPPLHRLIFIEKKAARFKALDQIRAEWPGRQIDCFNGDANAIVSRLCANINWRRTRAVMFLDPYGAQVSWETLRAIAGTQAVDLWYFFSLMSLYRQAAHDPAAIDAHKRASLDRLLGTSDWEGYLYGTAPPSPQASLFEMDNDEVRRRADVDALESFAGDRLRTIFAGGVLPPRRIFNSRGNPVASLFFAISNPRAKGVATNIADYILSSGRASHVRSR